MTRKILQWRADCWSSGGLNGYEFSHRGSFASGHMIRGYKRETTEECANDCNEWNQCIAFNYRPGDDKRSTCTLYEVLDKRLYEWTESAAYIKCSSMYLFYTSECFRNYP